MRSCRGTNAVIHFIVEAKVTQCIHIHLFHDSQASQSRFTSYASTYADTYANTAAPYRVVGGTRADIIQAPRQSFVGSQQATNPANTISSTHLPIPCSCVSDTQIFSYIRFIYVDCKLFAYPPHTMPYHVCGCYFFHPTQRTRQYLPQVKLEAHTTVLSTASRTVLKQNFINPSEEEIEEIT